MANTWCPLTLCPCVQCEKADFMYVYTGYYTRLLKLYNDLGITLEKSNFTYSFFELSSSSSSASSSRQDRRFGMHHRPSRDTRHCLANGNEKSFSASNQKKHPEEQSETYKRSTFIYNGGNGLSLRPVSFPSASQTILDYSLSFANLLNLFYYFYDMLHMIVKASFFAGCYIYLALLSFYHVFSSHTSPTSTHPLHKSTLASFLSSTYLPHSFIVEIIIPLFSCVATCSPEEVMAYPAGEILEYIAKTFGTDHYIVKGGVRNVVQGLLKDVPEENIHLGCELTSLRRIKPSTEGGEVDVERGRLDLKEASSGQSWSFDEVIFATQANQARFLLADYYKSLHDSESPLDVHELSMEKERLDSLGKFSYTTSVVVNHYDEGNTLPSSHDDRRILNLARWSDADIAQTMSSKLLNEEKLDSSKRLGKEYIMATHDLSILHPNCRSPSSGAALLQTTNPTVKIEEGSIVSSQVFERAIMTLESKETLKQFMKYPRTSTTSSEDKRRGAENEDTKCFQGLGGIWFVGSWAAEGIPLLEGCVVSAERAVEAICA